MKSDEPIQVFEPSQGTPLPRVGKSTTLACRAHSLLPSALLYIRRQLRLPREVAFSPCFRCVAGHLRRCVAGNLRRCVAGNLRCSGAAFLCDTFFVDYAPIHIGHGVGFSYRNIVITSTHIPGHMDRIEARPFIFKDHCWITSNCTILGGVTIGAHSVIGAGSVVTRSITPGVFAAGNPCRPIREL